MKPWVHALLSSVLAALIYPVFNWKVLFILAGGVLIDIDHYLWYIYKYKKFSLVDCYKHFIVDNEKNNYKDITGGLLIFHTIEFLLIAILFSLYNNLAFMFTIGLLSHYLLDFIWHCYAPKRVIVNHSIISWINKNIIQKV